MAQDFASLKAGRSTSATALLEQVQKLNKPQYDNQKDERYWQPLKDNSGSGFAIIRFLPAPQDEDSPIAKMYQYSYHNTENDQWYIEKCRSTLGEPDPMNELNRRLYASKKDENIAEAKKHPRKTTFIANIMVLKHPARPEDEGKVFLFGFGKKIMEKINTLLEPEFEDEQQRNPFDFWEGANFRLKVRKVDGFPNYDKSEFDSNSALSDDDEKLAEIWKSQYSLTAEVAPDKFKDYDYLSKRLNKVLGLEDDEDITADGKHADAEVNSEVEDDASREGSFTIETGDDAMSGDEALDFLKKISKKGDDSLSA